MPAGSSTLNASRIFLVACLSSAVPARAQSPDGAALFARNCAVCHTSATGKIIWKTYLIPEEPRFQRKTPNGSDEWGPSGNAIWSAPTIDRKRGALYVGVGNAYTMPETSMRDAVVALSLKTGKTLWVRQLTTRDVYECRKNDEGCGDNIEQDADIATSPVLSKLQNGKEVLTLGQKNGFGFALDPDREGAIIWRYRAGEGGALGGIQWGIAVDGERAYFPVADVGRPQPGGLHAVSLETGERVWYTPAPPPLCGTPSRGSNGPAPTVAAGMLYVSSGDYRGFRGNVLLAFAVD